MTNLKTLLARFSDPAYQAAERAREAEEQAQVAQVLLREKWKLLKALALPERALAVVTSGRLVRTPAIEALSSTTTPILLYAGNVGSGKTVPAVVWNYRRVVDDSNWQADRFGARFVGGDGLFVTAAQLSCWRRWREPEDVDRLLSADWLTIDDLGSEALDRYDITTAFLDEVFNSRYAKVGSGCVHTLITSNLAPASFRQRYGDRVFDRLKEAATWFETGSISMRGSAP